MSLFSYKQHGAAVMFSLVSVVFSKRSHRAVETLEQN